MSQDGPIAGLPEIWPLVLFVASDRFDIDIAEILSIEGTWENYECYSADKSKALASMVLLLMTTDTRALR